MLNWMSELLDKFLSFIVSVLPTSPFRPYIDQLADVPYLSYINYFVPVGTFIKIGAAWLTAIALYYSYSIIARWIKLIS